MARRLTDIHRVSERESESSVRVYVYGGWGGVTTSEPTPVLLQSEGWKHHGCASPPLQNASQHWWLGPLHRAPRARPRCILEGRRHKDTRGGAHEASHTYHTRRDTVSHTYMVCVRYGTYTISHTYHIRRDIEGMSSRVGPSVCDATWWR